MPLKEIGEGFLEVETTKSESVTVPRARAVDSSLFSPCAWSADCDVCVENGTVRGRLGPCRIFFICHTKEFELPSPQGHFRFFISLILFFFLISADYIKFKV